MRLHDLTRPAPDTLTSTVERPATTIPELVERMNRIAEPLTIREQYNHEVSFESCPLLAVSIDEHGEYNKRTNHERLQDVTRACRVVTARWADVNRCQYGVAS